MMCAQQRPIVRREEPSLEIVPHRFIAPVPKDEVDMWEFHEGTGEEVARKQTIEEVERIAPGVGMIFLDQIKALAACGAAGFMPYDLCHRGGRLTDLPAGTDFEF